MSTRGRLYFGLGLAGILGYHVLGGTLQEYRARYAAYRWGQAYCRRVGKQLLSIGMKRWPWNQPNGDVTLDIDPLVEQTPGGILGDERSLWMFSDKQFGVCLNSHTLEHLPTVDDVRRALVECSRVADYLLLLFPSPNYLSAYMEPAHKLLIENRDGWLAVCDIETRLRCDWAPVSANTILAGSQWNRRLCDA